MKLILIGTQNLAKFYITRNDVYLGDIMRGFLILFFLVFTEFSNALEVGQSITIKPKVDISEPQIWIDENSEVRISGISVTNYQSHLTTLSIDGNVLSSQALTNNFLSTRGKFFPELKSYIFRDQGGYRLVNPMSGEFIKFESETNDINLGVLSLFLQNGEYRLLAFGQSGREKQTSIIELWNLDGNKLSSIKADGFFGYRRHVHFVKDSKEYLTVVYSHDSHNRSAIVTFDLASGEVMGRESQSCNFEKMARKTVTYKGRELLAVPSQAGCSFWELKPYDSVVGVVFLDPFNFKMVQQYRAEPLDCLGYCYKEPHIVKIKGIDSVLIGTANPKSPGKKMAHLIDIESGNKEFYLDPFWVDNLGETTVLLSRSSIVGDSIYYTIYDSLADVESTFIVELNEGFLRPQKADKKVFLVGPKQDSEEHWSYLTLKRLY